MPKTKVTITAETEALPQLQRNQLAIMDLLELVFVVAQPAGLAQSAGLAGLAGPEPSAGFAVVAVISYVYRKYPGGFPPHPAEYVGWGA